MCAVCVCDHLCGCVGVLCVFVCDECVLRECVLSVCVLSVCDYLSVGVWVSCVCVCAVSTVGPDLGPEPSFTVSVLLLSFQRYRDRDSGIINTGTLSNSVFRVVRLERERETGGTEPPGVRWAVGVDHGSWKGIGTEGVRPVT